MELLTAHNKAGQQAYRMADAYIQQHGESFPCGFAWVEIKVDGRSKIAKDLKKIGFEKSWQSGRLYLWNPSEFASQSVDVLEAGAISYADTMRELTGLDFYAQSRLD
jgi:hypothetical protein